MTASILERFGTSVFTVFSRLAREAEAINLGQGFPDFDGPEWIQDAARDAMRRGHNQYAIGHGAVRLREAVAADVSDRLGIAYDPETEVTVTTGATEGIAAATLGILDEGDEVLSFEPFYDSYPVCAALAGATFRAVPLRPPAFGFDRGEVERAFSDRTRMFVLNTPHNPTGRVFTEEECGFLVDLCRKHDALLVTDEVYEHLVFDRHRHFSPAALDRERTLRLSSAAKTFSLTGWKVGWACGGAEASAALRRAHQFLVFSTAAPLQDAIATALEQSPERGYYEQLRSEYTERRGVIVDGLRNAGYRLEAPEGSYFAMADFSPLSAEEEPDAFVRRLTAERRVGAIPPESFYLHPEHARGLVRFAFCKQLATLGQAMRRLLPKT